MRTRLLVIGGVAGGATAAARARRVSEEAEITVVERGPYVSYANCGLPYFIGRDIDKRSKLLLQTPEGFAARYRVTALAALGMAMRYRGAVATSVVKVFEATAAMTGLSERAAREAGLDVGVAVIHKDHHASYYPGGEPISLKLVYERSTGRLLGAQGFGRAGVDKRIDVLATALHGRMTLADLSELDLAYAPPYSSANDPVNLAAFAGQNDVSGFSPLITAGQLARELASPNPPLVLDVRTAAEWKRGYLSGAIHVPLDDLRGRLDSLPRGRRIAVHCHSGFRAHLAVRILKERGIDAVVNVTGGFLSMRAEGGFAWEES